MTTEFAIPLPENYRYTAVIDSHGWRQLAPFRYDEAAKTLYRTHRLVTGRVSVISMVAADHHLTVQSDLALTDDEQVALTTDVRQMLAVDTDMTPFYDRIRGIPRYEWVEPAGAGRIMTAPTVWEELVKTLLTTNVSWTNTVSMVRRLVDFGDEAADGSRTFPTAAQLTAIDPDTLNAHVRSGYRIKSLHLLAQRVASGDVDVESWRTHPIDAETAYKNIKSLHGFGEYATGSVMRLLGHHDILGLDSVCRDAYAQLFNGGEKAPDSDIEAFYAEFGRWRGLALWMDVLSTD